MVQTVNLTECRELVQDLLSDISGHSWEKGGRRSDAKEYDSRSIKRGGK